MPPGLSYELYKLTALLERAADELLRREQGVSYARFLALLAAKETNGSQRDLARWLGQTEPSTSRMVTVLAADGLLEVTRLEGGGNRRRLRLTTRGPSWSSGADISSRAASRNWSVTAGCPTRRTSATLGDCWPNSMPAKAATLTVRGHHDAGRGPRLSH